MLKTHSRVSRSELESVPSRRTVNLVILSANQSHQSGGATKVMLRSPQSTRLPQRFRAPPLSGPGIAPVTKAPVSRTRFSRRTTGLYACLHLLPLAWPGWAYGRVVPLRFLSSTAAASWSMIPPSIRPVGCSGRLIQARGRHTRALIGGAFENRCRMVMVGARRPAVITPASPGLNHSLTCSVTLRPQGSNGHHLDIISCPTTPPPREGGLLLQRRKDARPTYEICYSRQL